MSEHTHLSLKHTPVDSRTAELIVAAIELRQRDTRCERRQRACVKRANPVSFEKKERNGGYVGFYNSTLLSVETRECAPVN
jgi:hypothetical protein